MSILSSRPDGYGFYYGLAPDGRQINVRFEVINGICEPMRYIAYVGGEQLPTGYIFKDEAEAAAIAWAKENPEGTMRTYSVTIPVAGHITVAVEAENQEEAKKKAFEVEVTADQIDEWTTLESFVSGNVCHCPSPWKIEATEE